MEVVNGVFKPDNMNLRNIQINAKELRGNIISAIRTELFLYGESIEYVKEIEMDEVQKKMYPGVYEVLTKAIKEYHAIK